jgi:hypothetical protein
MVPKSNREAAGHQSRGGAAGVRAAALATTKRARSFKAFPDAFADSFFVKTVVADRPSTLA